MEETKAQSIEILPLGESHLVAYTELPLLAEHRDPFDRGIIATAFSEQLDVVTTDEKFHFYPDHIKVVW